MIIATDRLTEQTNPNFPEPTECYMKLAHDQTDIMLNHMDASMMKVRMYVMRHTCGFSNWGGTVRLTLDEFINGRTQSDGSRMDGGCGLKKRNAVVSALRRLVAAGWLYEQVDDRDQARVRKSYGVANGSADSGTTRGDRMSGQELPQVTSEVTAGYPGSDRGLPRSYKETPEINKGKSKSGLASEGHLSASLTSPFDKLAAGRLLQVLEEHYSPLTEGEHPVRVETLEDSITDLRVHRKVTEQQIAEMIKWLRGHYCDEWTPKMHKHYDFYDFWEKYVRAKRQHEAESARFVKPAEDAEDLDRLTGHGSVRREEWSAAPAAAPTHKQRIALMWAVRDYLSNVSELEEEEQPLSQNQLWRALAELGERPDALTLTFVNSMGTREKVQSSAVSQE